MHSTAKTDRWVPLREAHVRDLNEEDVDLAMQTGGYATRAEARADLELEARQTRYWINDLYQVAVHKLAPTEDCPLPILHLNIRRRDGKVIFRDWRHFQRIKNELAGEDAEAVEIYPAEDRLADTSNKYHLWCFPRGYRLPYGLQGRLVLDDTGTKVPGFRQRRL